MSSNTGIEQIPAARVIMYKVPTDKAAEFKAWSRSVSDMAKRFPGYLGFDILPPAAQDAEGEWAIIYRFESDDTLRNWLDSSERAAALASVEGLFKTRESDYTLSGGKVSDRSVTIITSHRVIPGQEAAYEAANNALNTIAARFPGFAGYEVFPPNKVNEDFTVLVRFDNKENMDRWLASPERAAGREALYKTTVRHQTHVIATGFGSWFAVNAENSISAAAWKQAMVVLFALFPTVMLLNLTVGSVLEQAGAPFALNVFVGNMLGTIALTWLMMPVAARLMGWWLSPHCAPRLTWLGVPLLLAIYAIEIAGFMMVR